MVQRGTHSPECLPPLGSAHTPSPLWGTLACGSGGLTRPRTLGDPTNPLPLQDSSHGEGLCLACPTLTLSLGAWRLCFKYTQ